MSHLHLWLISLYYWKIQSWPLHCIPQCLIFTKVPRYYSKPWRAPWCGLRTHSPIESWLSQLSWCSLLLGHSWEREVFGGIGNICTYNIALSLSARWAFWLGAATLHCLRSGWGRRCPDAWVNHWPVSSSLPGFMDTHLPSSLHSIFILSLLLYLQNNQQSLWWH